MFQKYQKTFREFPARFWVLVLATFIDMIGGTMIFPFFALYITQKFDVGMTQAGVLLAMFSFSGLIGGMLGGALTDKFGRKGMVLFGLVVSALSSLTMGFVSQFYVFYPLVIFVGLLSSVGHPAQQAMVADLLPEEKRTEGFGILRVAANLAWIIGPTIGGFVASRSYLALFITDAVLSLITAAIVLRMLPETKPEAVGEKAQESFLKTLSGYRQVIADRLYMAFLLASILMLIVYQQMYNTLSVYLRDVHGVPAQGYGFMLTSSAITVVLLQFWVTRRTKNYPPLLMMALGGAFYVVGFSMFGFVAAYFLFVTAVVLITFGEMIVVPIGQSLAASFAPADMRGRYMAFFGLSWALPSTIGPWAAGLIMDNYDPRWVWYLGGIIATLSVLAFLWLYAATRQRFAVLQESPSPAAD